MKPELQQLENPTTISKWLQIVKERKYKSYEVEMHYLSMCTDQSQQYSMMMTDKKFIPKNRYSDILVFKQTRIDL